MSVGARHSCDKQQQSTTTWLIVMVGIKAITNHDGRNQCHHCEMPKRSRDKHLECNKGGHGNKQCLEATRQPCQQTRQEHHEIVMSITTILIPQRQLLSQEHQLPQCKRNKCKKTTLYARNIRQIGQIHAPDLPQRPWDQQQNIQKSTCKQNKKTKPL